MKMKLPSLIALLKSGWKLVPEKTQDKIVDQIREAIENAIKEKFAK